MISLDVTKPYGGSLAAAAQAVKAKMLIVAAKQDHMVNPLPALEFAADINAPVIELESDCGTYRRDAKRIRFIRGCALSWTSEEARKTLAHSRG